MILDALRVAPVRWRNGAGATRELAIATDSDGETLWRISLADIDKAAPFSEFPGLDRLFTALGELRLTIDGSVVHLESGGQVRFPGEALVSVALDQPTRALNVMTRRGAWHADVVHRPAGQRMSQGAHAIVVLGELDADVLLTSLTAVADV